MYSAKFICVFSEDNLELLLVYSASGKIQSLQVDGGDYTLEYQPVLVSSRITSNILGIYTEMQFKETVRDQENESTIFMPKDAKSGTTVCYYKEKLSQNSACVRIAKATVVPVKSMRMVQSKIRGSMQGGKETSSFVFDPLEMQNEDMEIADLVMDKVTKHMRIPIYNDSEEEIMLKKGEIIGLKILLKLIHMMQIPLLWME